MLTHTHVKARRADALNPNGVAVTRALLEPAASGEWS